MSSVAVIEGVVVTEPAHLAEAIELLQQEASVEGRPRISGLRVRDDYLQSKHERIMDPDPQACP